MHDEEANAPEPAVALRASRTATARSSSGSAPQRRAPAPGGLLDGRRQASTAATSPPSRSAASREIQREYSGGYARTTVEQNFVLRWVRDEAVYEVWQRSRRARPRRGRLRRDHRHGLLPGHRQLQARHHQLDGPQRARCNKRLEGDGHRGRAHASKVHIKNVRLPERLQPAPHRQHRLLRRVDQGRRQDDPGLHPAHRRHVRGRRGDLRHAAEVAPAVQARARRRRALAAVLRGRARRRARSSTPSPSAWAPDELHRAREGPGHAASSSTSRTWTSSSTGNRDELYQVVRGEGECAVCEHASDPATAGGRRCSEAPRHRRAPSAHRAGLLLPEGGGGAGAHAARAGARRARVHDRHRRALPRDLRHVARARGAHGRQGRGVRRRVAGLALDRRATAAAQRRSPRSSEALGGLDAWVTGMRARAGAHPRGRRPSSAGTRPAACGRSTRCRLDREGRLGATCTSTSFPTTRCTTRAMRRSAARRAPCPAAAARAAGPAPTRPSAGCTNEHRRQRPRDAASSSRTCASWRRRRSTSSARWPPSCERPVLLF